MTKIKFILLFVIVLTIPIAQKSSKEIQSDIINRNIELEKIRKDIEDVESEINFKINEENNNKEIITKIDSKIILTEKLIQSLVKEEIYLSKLISKTEDRILVKEKELMELQNQLKNRVRYLYKYGRENILEELFNLEKTKNKIYRLKYLNILNEHENEIKNRINRNIKTLKNEKDNLTKEKKRKKQLLDEKNKKYENLEVDRTLKKTYLNKLKKEKIDLENKLLTKKKNLKQIETIISDLYKDKKESKKREKELELIRSRQNKSTTGNFSKMKGKLRWPTDGNIISSFGIQKNSALNTTYENIGIDIKGKSNSSVIAVVDGVVTVREALEGYNTISELLIINHGGGYLTVYKNIDNIQINVGDYISEGEKIAGIAKNSANNHVLHFEVWKDAKKINPEDWLIKK